MDHIETTIRKTIKKGFEILDGRNNSTERDVQLHVVFPVLEKLGYSKDDFSLEKHCRIDKKDLYADVYIEVGSGTGILVETKKAKKELTSPCLSQLYTYLGVETIKWGILTNGSRYILINRDIKYDNIGEDSIWQSVVLDIDFGMDSSRRNEKFIEYLGLQRIFEDSTTCFFRDVQQYFCYNDTLSPKNYNTYSKTLLNFFDFYIRKGNSYRGKALEAVRPKDAIQFLCNYKGGGRPRVRPEIPKSKVDHICAMYKVLYKNSYIQSNPMEDLRQIVREENRIILKDSMKDNNKIAYDVLLNNEILEIIWKHMKFQKPHRKIIFILVAYYGFEQSRVVSFLNLTWEKKDIDLDKKVFFMGKTKYHMVEKLYESLTEQKNKLGKRAKWIHYDAKKGTPATCHSVTGTFNFIKSIKSENEIIKLITAENLRAALIKHLFYAGISFEEINYLTGLSMTQYAQYVCEQEITDRGTFYWEKNRSKGASIHPFSVFFEMIDRNV